MANDPDLQGLKDSLIQSGVKYCLPSYVDIHGVSKSKFVPIAHFDRMMNGSELCTGAALDGFLRMSATKRYRRGLTPKASSYFHGEKMPPGLPVTSGVKASRLSPAAETSSKGF